MTYLEQLSNETSDINIRELTHEQFIADDKSIMCYMEGEDDDKVFYLFYLTKFYTDYKIRIRPSKRKHDIFTEYKRLNENEITKQKILAGRFLFLTDKDYSNYATENWEKEIFENNDFFKTKNHSLENYFIKTEMLTELLYYFRSNDETENIIEKFKDDYENFTKWLIPTIAVFSLNTQTSNPVLKIDSIKISNFYNICIDGSPKTEINKVTENLLSIANIDIIRATFSENIEEAEEKISNRIIEFEEQKGNEIIRGKQALDFFIEYAGLLKKEQSFFKKNKRNKILSLIHHKNFEIPTDFKNYLTENLIKIQQWQD